MNYFKFELVVLHGARCELSELERYYNKDVVKKYKLFLLSLRNQARSQLKSDLRLNQYDLVEMIESGQLDVHGCYDTLTMKKIRLEGL